MKKLLAFAFSMMIALVAYAEATSEKSNTNGSEAERNPANEQQGRSEQVYVPEKEQTEEDRGSEEDIGMNSGEQRIIVAFDGGEISIKLYDNPTSKAFLEQLPLTLTFEEFSGFEILSYPPEKLTTEEASSGYVPARGDFAYYSPWGNVTMFYADHTYSAGLVKLGEIESGVELLDRTHDDFTVTIREIE